MKKYLLLFLGSFLLTTNFVFAVELAWDGYGNYAGCTIGQPGDSDYHTDTSMDEIDCFNLMTTPREFSDRDSDTDIRSLSREIEEDSGGFGEVH